jgi:hypothetical protein
MSKTFDYHSFVTDELSKISLSGLIIPFVIGAVLFYIWMLNYDNLELAALFFIFPSYGFVIPFFIIYRNFFKIWNLSRKDKSAKNYFEFLGYEKAVLRYQYIDKLHKYAIVILIALSIFVIFGIILTLQIIDDNRNFYFEKMDQNKKELEYVKGMSEMELRQYLNIEFESLSKSKKIFWLSDLVDVTYYHIVKVENMTMPKSVLQTEQENIKKLSSNQIIPEINKQIDELPLLEIQALVNLIIEDKKLSKFFYDNDPYFQQQYFLIGLVILPGIMVYSIFMYKSIHKYRDFHFHFSKGCFLMLQAISPEDVMIRKSFFILGIIHYDKFLKKHLKMKMNQTSDIISTFVSDSSENMQNSSKIIVHKMDHDTELELLNYLSLKSGLKDPSKYLVLDTFIDRLKDSSQILATVISTILGSVGLLIGVLVHFLN